MRNARAIVVVLDGVGVGALPDAAAYGDEGAHTLAHTAQAVDGLAVPHLAAMGLGHIATVLGVPRSPAPGSHHGRLTEISAGKDTITGHWELMGVVTSVPFPTYPAGLPGRLLDEFARRIGRPVLGGQVASGTEIIAELGGEHLRTGCPVVYTSADSVFQIAAHEGIVPVDQLYQWCQIARGMLQPPDHMARVIARPFAGEPGAFVRTPRRRDFALPSPPNQLDAVAAAGGEVRGVGKVDDMFAGRAFSTCRHVGSNAEGITALMDALASDFAGVVLVNLNDTDTRYGHRNDPEGFAASLEEFDAAVPALLARLRPDDLLIITADHGCDPTTPSTDHTREYVPVLVREPGCVVGRDLGTRPTLADVGATAAEWLGVERIGPGTSLLAETDGSIA
ncbi:MAG TPA: phosphopentomutase [Armatimonadota bacterium]|nr:phosphopentomutase [Armatimonadota bacterium]